MQADDTSRSAQGAPEPGYNGWANYETWCVNLWLNNDQGTYDRIMALGRACENPADFGQAIRNDLEASNPVAGEATVFTDLLNGALCSVDWHQIADGFMGE